MSSTQKLTLFFFGILLSTVAFAAGSPANIQHVEAGMTNGQLTVTWNAAADAADIDFYRIYYSHQSILQNNGDYDDFERTTGAERSYTFKNIPANSGMLFVSVLAVNKAGIESEGFETEASVMITESIPVPQNSSSAPQTSSSSEESSSSQSENGTTSEPMTITTVEAASLTGVLVSFSKALSPVAPIDGAYFMITDTGGTVYAVTRVQIGESTLLLHTAPLDPNKKYILTLTQNVLAADGTNATPSTTGQLAFAGFGEDTSAPTSSSSSVMYVRNPALGSSEPAPAPVTAPEDATGLDLTPMHLANGNYNVLARWGASPDSKGTLDSYGLYTSANGSPFAWNAATGKMETSVEYRNLAPGTFGLKVTAKDAQGNESAGIQRSVTLPASGIGLIGIAALSGAAAGARTRKRKNTAA
jgi:hypothetical protein